MATWKSVERRIAKLLGGERVGPTGEATCDVLTDWLAVEVKHRAKLPAWLKAALLQARDAQNGEDRLPIVVLHEKYRNHDTDMVLMSLADFIAWFGDDR